ncbi:hypothetical protein GCM10009830_00820 [Glycomyces endophyticus]|uniref:Secreted protein n=1 Tax=Glycomyces endophyticus TaxID=480996 RepID=A0ABN2FU74_9ACTN
MATLRKTKIAVYSISAVAVAAVAAVLLAPNQIGYADEGTCVFEYLDGRYLAVSSCDSPFASAAVIVSRQVTESMRGTTGWERRFCEANVDGRSTYAVVEVDGGDRIVCLGSQGH